MVALVEHTGRAAFESSIDRKHVKVHLAVRALMADDPKVGTPLVLVALEGVPSRELLLFLGVGWALGRVLLVGLRFGVLFFHMVGRGPLLLLQGD
jgi:hypothetical protein